MAKNMAKKPAKKGPDPLGPALQFFLAGFVAECVLLVIYNFFINANSTTFYPMYYSLQVLQYAGPVAAAAGAVLLLLVFLPDLLTKKPKADQKEEDAAPEASDSAQEEVPQ